MFGTDVKALPTSELVIRMDTIRRRATTERFPQIKDQSVLRTLEQGRVADLQDTILGRAMDDKRRCRLADASFRFLLQLDMLMAVAGISNSVLRPYNWSSPKYCINSTVLAQYKSPVPFRRWVR